jgi:predicted Zn-dependent protease
MKKIFLPIIIFLVSCAIPMGGAKKIEDIKPQEAPSIESIEAGLWMQMNNYEEKLKTSGSRLKDKGLEKYLKNILCKLTPDYCKDIRVYVQDIPYFNAFMAPNGMMVVWTGLLLRAQNEAQVAAVIGHEAGHYIKRHSLKSWLDAKSRTDLMALLSIGLAVGGVPSGGDIFNLTQLLQVGFMAKHSRDNEREADKVGLDFLIKAGYDPSQAPKIWENIIKEMELGDVNKPLTFLASHPAPEERIENLKKQTEGYENIENKKNQKELKEKIQPHLKKWIKNEIRLNNEVEQTEFVLDTTFENSKNQYLLKFYKGEVYRLRGDKENNYEKAIDYYNESIKEKNDFPNVYRELGLLQFKIEQDNEAKKNLKKYLELAKNPKDAPIIESYLN